MSDVSQQPAPFVQASPPASPAQQQPAVVPGVVPVAPTGVQPVSPAQQQQPAQQPAQQPVQQPAQQPVQQPVQQPDPIAGFTPQQLNELEQRIAVARQNRPQSLTDQLAALQQQLTDSHRGKDAAVDARKEASQQADEMQKAIAEIHRTLRRTELIEAATVAGFTNPQVVADSLVGRDGDTAALIAAAVASGGYAMTKPATSAQVGGPAAQTPPGMDPGVAALVAEIRQATGR